MKRKEHPTLDGVVCLRPKMQTKTWCGVVSNRYNHTYDHWDSSLDLLDDHCQIWRSITTMKPISYVLLNHDETAFIYCSDGEHSCVMLTDLQTQYTLKYIELVCDSESTIHHMFYDYHTKRLMLFYRTHVVLLDVPSGTILQKASLPTHQFPLDVFAFHHNPDTLIVADIFHGAFVMNFHRIEDCLTFKPWPASGQEEEYCKSCGAKDKPHCIMHQMYIHPADDAIYVSYSPLSLMPGQDAKMFRFSVKDWSITPCAEEDTPCLDFGVMHGKLHPYSAVFLSTSNTSLIVHGLHKNDPRREVKLAVKNNSDFTVYVPATPPAFRAFHRSEGTSNSRQKELVVAPFKALAFSPYSKLLCGNAQDYLLSFILNEPAAATISP